MKTLTISVITLVVFLTVVGFSASTWSGDNANTKEVTLKVDGMTCKMCPLTIKTALKRLDGVVDVNVSYENKEARVRYEGGKVTVDEMIKAIENAGNYRVTLLDKEER